MTTYMNPDSEDLDSIGTLPAIDKSLLKNDINRHQNNNVSAGYIPSNEGIVHQATFQGRKTYLFWSLVGLLCLLAWANMIITLVIFRVLRLGSSLESMELLPEESSVKFLGSTDLGTVLKPDGEVEAFAEEGLTVRGPLYMETHNAKGHLGAVFNAVHNGTSVSGVSKLQITSAEGQKVFSTQNPHFNLPGGAHNLVARITKTSRISSGIDQKLVIRSDSFAKLRGSEGTKMEAREIVWSADQVVTLHSSNGSIVLGGRDGVTLDVRSIPIVSGPGTLLAAQYKVCVCMPQGRLFRVPVSTDYSSQIACHNIDQSRINSPCM